MEETTEAVLVKALSAGDMNAFEKLYMKYKTKLHYYCLSKFMTADNAEDLVQEIFIKLWENRESLCPEMSFTSFLFTITHNKIVTHIRRQMAEQNMISKWHSEYPDFEDSILSEIIASEYDSLLKKAVENMPPKRKLVFHLSREEGLSHKEIARQLGISVHTVQEHISESLTYFRFNLSKHPDISSFLAKKIRIAEAS